ncbi:MAG TPA: 50S ribosomal protein L11 methyltransferase [Mesorhizobium sp.]|nr:50S ribosomal protein L11 methyltransferase [Mesorhizobium sp.]
MGATKLFVTIEKAREAETFSALDRAFEDEGLPIGSHDVEEDGPLVEISVYTHEPEAAAARMASALAAMGIRAEVEREELPEIDWVAHSLEGLRPVRVGRFLVHGSHDRASRRPNDLSIEIEAGLAFGTGHHGTTAGCLEMLTRVVHAERPVRMLDLGSGSGVLAIALAKLTKAPVLATDIDPVAVRVARGNARLNGVAGLVEAEAAAGFHAPAIRWRTPFDLIVANILARPLMQLAPQFAEHLIPGGSAVLSGILVRQRRAVVAVFVGQGFRHVRTIEREGWSTIHLKR